MLEAPDLGNEDARCRRSRVGITGVAPNVVPVPAGVDPVELLRRCEPVIRFSDLIEHGWTELAQGP